MTNEERAYQAVLHCGLFNYAKRGRVMPMSVARLIYKIELAALNGELIPATKFVRDVYEIKTEVVAGEG